VIINVQNGLTVAAGSSIADPSVPASAIRWNLVSGNVSVGGNGAALGVFYAPNSDLDIGGTGDFYGATMPALRADATYETSPVSCLMKSTAYRSGF